MLPSIFLPDAFGGTLLVGSKEIIMRKPIMGIFLSSAYWIIEKTYLNIGQGKPTTGHKINTSESIGKVEIFQGVRSPTNFGGKLLVGSEKNQQLGFCT